MRPRRRWRWGKWVWRVVGSAPVVALLGVGIWGYWVERRVEGRLAALRAAGEPVYPGDFESATPAAGKNGADDLIEAGRRVRTSAEMKAYDALTANYVIGLPLTEGEARAIDGVLSANGTALALAESGLGKPAVRWPADFALPLQSDDWLTEIRVVATTLQLDALRAHQAGRDAEAVARVRQILALARLVDRHPRIIAHLVANGIDAFASHTLEQMVGDLKVEEKAKAASPKAVRELIATLLDDGPSRAAMVRALQGQRKDGYLHMLGILEQPTGVSRPFVRFESRGFVMSNAEMIVRLESAWIEAFRGSNDLPAALGNAEVTRLTKEADESHLEMLATMFACGIDRAVQVQYRRTADCRLAAVGLAIRLYEVEHGGARPGALTELAPAYLPVVPADPMARVGAALRYVSAGGRAIVYSVGVDGVDDGGSEAARPGVRLEDGEPVDRWQGKDAVFSLVRRGRWFGRAE